MHTLKLHLQGEFCNDYPNLSIKVDGNLFYDGAINNNKFEIPLSNNTTIVLTHYGKCFGKNRRWDTVVQDGNIIADRKILIKQILVDDIDISLGLKKLSFVQNPTDQEPIQPTLWNGIFSFNGSVTLDISPTPLSWVTNLLYKVDETNLSYFSNYSKLFHYEEELQLIDEIEKCLKELP